MRQLAHEAREQIGRLYEALNARPRLFRPTVDLAPSVEAVAKEGGLPAVPYLAPLLLDRREPVVIAAARWVVDLLRAATPRDLAWLDLQMRVRFPYNDPLWMQWVHLQSGDLARLRRGEETTTLIIGLASFHNSGYVREEAVAQLAEMWHGDELAFLLLRVNDWVARVRARARRAAEQRLSLEYAGHFVTSLPLVFRLAEGQREDHSTFVAAVTTLLQRPEARESLWQGITSPDRWVGRCCFQIACDAGGPGLRAAVEYGLQATDLLIRQRAARAAPAAYADEDLRDLLVRMREDRAVAVRREALSITVERDPQGTEEALRRALLDSHPAIRGDARRAVTLRGQLELAPFYREALADTECPTLASALAGLAETGTADDAPLALAYRSHPRVRVRRAVVRCVAQLAGDAHVPFLLEALQDDAPGVTRAAREALAPRLHAIGGTRLWSLFQEDSRLHVRCAALALIAKLWAWDSIAYLVPALCDPSHGIARQAEHHLMRWNPGFVEPTAAQLEALKSALDTAGTAIAPGIAEGVRETLRRGEEMLSRQRHSRRR